jgi:hypothetical protein
MLIQNHSMCKADFVLRAADTAPQNYDGFVVLLDGFFENLRKFYGIKAQPSFVLAHSNCPLQVLYLGDDIFSIIISLSVIDCLCNLCCRLQCCPPLSDFLAFSSLPISRDYMGKTIVEITRDMIFGNQTVEISNVDPSGTVINSALFYLVAHEYAHIAHGHMDFIASPEFKHFTQDVENRRLTFCALEMDADSSAVSMLIGYFEQVELPRLTAIPEEKVRLETVQTVVFQRYLAGMYCCFLLSDAITDTYLTKDHPIDYARFLGAISVAEIVLENKKVGINGITDRLREKFVELFVLLSGDINHLQHPMATNMMILQPGNERPRRIYSPRGVAAGLAHLEPLIYRWAEIRPFLETKIRGGFLAPAFQNPAHHESQL